MNIEDKRVVGMFCNCSGECCVCALDGCCLAGHGDDNYIPTSKEQVISNLKNGKYTTFPEYKNMMIQYLKDKYNYDWRGVK